jgi:hypothetical protein
MVGHSLAKRRTETVGFDSALAWLSKPMGKEGWHNSTLLWVEYTGQSGWWVIMNCGAAYVGILQDVRIFSLSLLPKHL